MLKKLFKDKKTRYRNLILVTLPFVLLIGVFGYLSADALSTLIGGVTGNTNVASDSIDSMDYHLINGATDLQKDLFKELNKAVESGESAEIAKSVVENFVADFYTWTNKAGQNDVGGMYYVYSPNKNNIYNQARNQFYKYVSTYINEYGQDNILEVASVEAEVSDEAREYTIGDMTYESYYVTCNWTYVDHKHFNEKDYYTKEYFEVIKNADGRFEIVQAYGDY